MPLSSLQMKMMGTQEVATMRVNVSAAAKRAVVVKEDDLPTKADTAANPNKISEALYTELKL